MNILIMYLTRGHKTVSIIDITKGSREILVTSLGNICRHQCKYLCGDLSA